MLQPKRSFFFVDFASNRIYFIGVMVNIEKIKPEVEQVCRRLPVKRLGLFGSALGRDFSQTSDVDVLVIFDSGEDIDLFDGYFELKEQLEKIFRRAVDLVVDKKFKNPVLRESINRTRVIIYERTN
jgi:predicted nucleotidyltransferase